jgi:cell division protein FtsB
MENSEKREGGSWTVKLFFLLSLAVLVCVAYSVAKVVYRKKQVQKEISGLQEEAAKIERDNNDLKDKVTYFESKDFQEKEVRDKLSLQLPDESLVVVKPGIAKEKEEKSAENAEIDRSVNDTPVYKKWWNYFFKY